MAYYLIKPDANDDFYLEWSTITDHPIGYGSRAEWEAHDPDTYNEVRFRRTDDTGSSALTGSYRYDEKSLIVYNVGDDLYDIPRKNWKAFTIELLDNWGDTMWPSPAAQLAAPKHGTVFHHE